MTYDPETEDLLDVWQTVNAALDAENIGEVIQLVRNAGITGLMHTGLPDDQFTPKMKCEAVLGNVLDCAEGYQAGSFMFMNTVRNASYGQYERMRPPPPPPEPPRTVGVLAADVEHVLNLATHPQDRSAEEAIARLDTALNPPPPPPRNGVKLACGCWHYGTLGAMAGRSRFVCDHRGGSIEGIHGNQLMVKANVPEPIDG